MDLIQNYLFYLSYYSLYPQNKLRSLWLLHKKEKLDKDELFQLIPRAIIQKIPSENKLLHILYMLKNELNSNKIHIISITSKNYPKRLSFIYDPPLFLYAKGNIHLINSANFIGIVGSREPSSFGWSNVNHIVNYAKNNQIGISSGLAKGVDSFSHIAAIKCKTPTIGVLAFGHNHCYPKENQKLFEYMCTNEITISEYPPHMPPKKHQFVRRNSIIAGISFAVVIIEAKLKSGSLLTGYEAIEQGKNVYVCSGPFLHPMYEGSHRIIQDGAIILSTLDDIVKEPCV